MAVSINSSLSIESLVTYPPHPTLPSMYIYFTCFFTTCRLQKKVQDHNLVVASYDLVRNDIQFFRSVIFCIISKLELFAKLINISLKNYSCNSILFVSFLVNYD